MVARTRGTPLLAGSGHHSLLLQARLSRGLAHVSSEHASSLAPAGARRTSPTDVWSLRVPHTCRQGTLPQWWHAHPTAGRSTMVVRALRRRSAYPNPHRKMLSLHPGWRGGSHGVCRNSGLAALLRAGVGAPRWWRSPTAATMVARPPEGESCALGESLSATSSSKPPSPNHLASTAPVGGSSLHVRIGGSNISTVDRQPYRKRGRPLVLPCSLWGHPPSPRGMMPARTAP